MGYAQEQGRDFHDDALEIEIGVRALKALMGVAHARKASALDVEKGEPVESPVISQSLVQPRISEEISSSVDITRS